MNRDATGLWVEQATWREVQLRLRSGAAAVLPVGAACKQHGEHLPMSTDRIQAEWLAGQVARRREVAIWPTLTYGYYPAFVAYAGSVSLEIETFIALAQQVLAGIARSGANRIWILNTGISTIRPLERAIAGPLPAAQTSLVNVYQGPVFLGVAEALQEQRYGSHADELETSILLAIDAQRVRMEHALAWDARPLTGAFDPDNPDSGGYSPSGVYGDATRATREKGEKLLEAMLTDILNTVS
jgi:creatinine amidohydrolase